MMSRNLCREFKSRCRVLVAGFAALLMAAPTLAQPSGKSRDGLKKEGEKLFSGKGKDAAAGKDPGSNACWSVVIEAFRGDDQDQAARDGLAKVRSEAGLTDAYLEKRGTATVIAYGRFAEGTSKQAKEGLNKVRNTEVLISNIKTKPFDRAFLAPPADIPGTMPEWDLRNAKKANGDWVIYTLQMAVYKRIDQAGTKEEMAEFRATAEKAVATLRREGEQAYYYHGPTGSMVTIGLFGKDDFDPQAPGVESAELTALRKRYPYNLLNGAAMIEKVTVTTQSGKQAKADRKQPSQLVAVPKGD